MATPSHDVMEMVLRECETAGKPWYPSEYVHTTGVDKETLDASVDQLRLGGLVELTDWVSGKGQGYVLTPEGKDVINSPRLLNQLRKRGVDSEPVDRPRRMSGTEDAPQWDRSKVVMESIMAPARPIVSMTLIGINLVVFVFGIYVAQTEGVLGDYVSMSPSQKAADKVYRIRYMTGSLELLKDRAENNWWRLLTCCFVHHGLLHLGMNMFALYILGPFVERMWGSLRFALLYLVAGIGGSVVAVVTAEFDVPLAGASGAICGLLGSALPWVLLNWSQLPRALASNLLRNVLINGVLITVISFLPNVSWAGHLGGAMAGAALAVPLNFSRFGIGGQRILGWAGVAILPLALFGYAAMKFAPSELQYAREVYGAAVFQADKSGVQFLKAHGNPFLKKLIDDEKASKKEVNNVLTKSAIPRQRVESAQKLIKGAGKYEDDRINSALSQSQEYLTNWQKYFETLPQCVTEDGAAVPAKIRSLQSILNRRSQLLKVVQDSVFFSSKSAPDN